MNDDVFTISISKSHEASYFVIEDCFEKIISNRRLKLSLKRLGYQKDNNSIYIPFRIETQIIVLKEIEKLLTKFNFKSNLSENTKKNVENYYREEVLFQEFSNKAKSIRNNEFKNNNELIDDFKDFQRTMKQNLRRSLYPLQLLSAFHMAFSQNSCNFAVPGAGKTSIVYAAYFYLKNLPKTNPKHVDNLLVIGPISSFAPWENEYEECFGKTTSFQRLSGDIGILKDTKLEHLYSPNPSEITLIFHGGVEAFQSDIIDFLNRNKTMVVVDEAHKIKNPEGVWGKSVTEISKDAISRVILTGTPVPNGYQDIYNLFKFIYPFKYKEILNFHFQNLVDMTRQSLTSSKRVTELKENLSPFFIRIKKKDLNLPPITETIISIDMDPAQREIYDFIESQYIPTFKEKSSATIKDILNRARLIRLRQASTNPALLSKTLLGSLEQNLYYDESDPNVKFTTDTDQFVDDTDFFNKICDYSKQHIPKKFLEILKLLDSIIVKGNGKVIIWTIFIQNAKELKNFLSDNGIDSELLIGEIPQEEREVTIEQFNDPENSNFHVIIANPFSVAESISLHKGCHNAIYLERDYNCSNFVQSKDRIHRVGLEPKQETHYFYIISSNSIDEVINNKLQDKIRQMEEIINDDIPLFKFLDDDDETSLIKGLLVNYAKRT